MAGYWPSCFIAFPWTASKKKRRKERFFLQCACEFWKFKLNGDIFIVSFINREANQNPTYLAKDLLSWRCSPWSLISCLTKLRKLTLLCTSWWSCVMLILPAELRKFVILYRHQSHTKKLLFLTYYVLWVGMPVTRPCYDIASCESLFSCDVVRFPPFILSLLSLVNISKNKAKYI